MIVAASGDPSLNSSAICQQLVSNHQLNCFVDILTCLHSDMIQTSEFSAAVPYKTLFLLVNVGKMSLYQTATSIASASLVVEV